MADKIEKKTLSQKLNSSLEKNRKILIAVLVVLFVALIGYIAWSIVNNKVTEKNIAEIDTISYELTNKSLSLDEAELKERVTAAQEKLEAYTKKGGVSGVRANMLAAEIAFSQKDYAKACEYWSAAYAKGKRSYTAPIAKFQMGVCYEQTKDLASAAECYKAAAETKGFVLASHALFSYGRVLEAQNNFAGAVEAYQMICDVFADDVWADRAKTRIIKLQIQGKTE